MRSSLFIALLATATAAPAADALRERLPQDEVIYFVLPDRFENGDTSNDRGANDRGQPDRARPRDDRLVHGFDPTSKAFYHGGDLRGLTERLDYIRALGATAVWLTPVFKNKPVQGGPGMESAGYHGYWVTDFTRVDPHLGDEAQMHAFVDAAHARGMKVYLDIIANHTADVIAYRECPTDKCPYRSRAEYPYSRHAGVRGEPINDGFAGTDGAHQTDENFARLTRPDYAYTPYLPRGEEHIKVPEWLNSPIYYHNRGNSTFTGESSQMGDFVGLDDLMTENPRVVQGFIEIYGDWIDRYGIDGYRIDTAKHVNAEFWQAFVPAMLARARARGIANFHIFGEVYTAEIDPALLAWHTRVAKLPSVLDFGFANAVRATVAGDSGTDKLARLFADDALYEGGEAAALQMPTFISNHDQGRFAWFVRKSRPQVSDDETLQRVLLANAMLFTLRGVPVVYYGDEQGFAGEGADQDARQDMMPSRTAVYLADRRIGGAAGTTNFNLQHPIARAIAELAALRRSQPALRNGSQVVRNWSETPGLFAVSRLDPQSGREVAIAFNTSGAALDTVMEVATDSKHFRAVHGQCEAEPVAPGSYRVKLAPFSFVVCAAAESAGETG